MKRIEQLNPQFVQDNADRLAIALNAAQMGMWDWDMLTSEINWSPEHEQLFGLSPGSFDGRYETFDACLHPDDRDSLEQAIAVSLREHQPYHHEYRVIWADGSTHWIEGRGQAFYTEAGEAVRMSGTIMAIDERKRLEHALKQSEQQFRAIFEAESECVKVVTVDGILRNMNPAGLAMIEADSLDAVLGRCVCPLIDPAYQQAFLEFTQQATQGKTAILEFEIVGLKGTRRWLESRGVPLQTSDQAEVLVLAVTRDITERKQAEMALQEQEALLRLFAQFAPAGIAMFDRDMRYVMASQRWIDEYSLESVEAVVGRSHYDIFPEIPERWRQIHQRCLAGAIEKCDDDLLIREDGTRQWISWEIRPWYTASGDIGGIIIFSVDVTLRRQAEETLEQRVAERTAELTRVNDRLQVTFIEQQQAKQELEDLYNYAPCGYHSLDADGRFVQINDTELDWLGYSRDEILHQKFIDFLTPESQQAFCDHFPCFKQQGWINNLEFQMVSKNGSSRWINLSATAIRDEAGNFIMSRSSLFDISDRKQAEASLHQSEDRFRQLAENIQDVFWVTDAANRQVLYVSPAYETVWGRNRETLYQNFREWLDAIHPDDLPRVEQTFREKAGKGHYDFEYRLIRPDGSIRWVRDRAFPVKNEAGDIIRTAGIAEDITERQKIEEIKNEFISIVSHELRTPLTAIQMSLGLLKTGIYANKPEKSQRMIEIAFIDTNRLVNLVNDILDLERLESGRAVLEQSECRAEDLIQQAIDGVQAIAAQHNVTLTTRPTDATVWAAGDTIIQTLTNLLSNAIKFSPFDSEVYLDAELRSDDVLFQVRDRGRGIPADKLEAIFGRFQQVDASDAREKGGTGLGLPICRSIIERQGGKIWAESTLGAGSTFFFTLPVPPEN
jgi:PAS domain S-box-containing protein